MNTWIHLIPSPKHGYGLPFQRSYCEPEIGKPGMPGNLFKLQDIQEAAVMACVYEIICNMVILSLKSLSLCNEVNVCHQAD